MNVRIRLILARVVAAGMALALAAAAAGASLAAPAVPFRADVMGPISDVTARWQDFQPATAFCIKPDVPQYTPGGSGATATGADPACRRSGFAKTDTGLVKITVRTPLLCTGCRRLFIDFSRIPATGPYAHGHAYYHLYSLNPTYTVDPLDHSPNTKSFSNDKLLVPEGSPQQPLVGAFDLHAIAYVTDTAHFVHTRIQGPYYIGPWYLNRNGERVDGAYLDVDAQDGRRFPAAQANAIGYAAGFNSATRCRSDADAFYAGCFDAWGFSSSTVDPYAPVG
jgi:hypothetical protein